MNKFEDIGRHTMQSPGDAKKAHGVKFESEEDLEQLFKAANLQYQRGLAGVFDDLEEECRSHLADRGLTWGQEIVKTPNLVLSAVRTLVYGSDFPKEEGMTVELTDGLSEADIRTWEIGHLLYSLLGLRKELTEITGKEEHADFAYRVFLFALHVERIKFRSMEKHALVKQRLMDSGREGGKSARRTERINERNCRLRNEARDLLNVGKSMTDIVYYMVVRYGGEKGYPSSERRYRTILKALEQK